MDIYTATLLKFKTIRFLRRPHLEMLCETADCLCLSSIFKLHFLKSWNIRSIIMIISIEEAFWQNVIKNFINRSQTCTRKHVFLFLKLLNVKLGVYFLQHVFVSEVSDGLGPSSHGRLHLGVPVWVLVAILVAGSKCVWFLQISRPGEWMESICLLSLINTCII